MSRDAVMPRLPSSDPGFRRLAGGLSISLLLHALVLSLQFGIPGLGLPGQPAPIRVRLADGAPAHVPSPAESSATPVPPAPELALTPPPPPTGMRLLAPSPPSPAPPAAVPVKPKLAVKKDKPRPAPRISPPLPSRETVEMASRVIAQDANMNDFLVPVPDPEEAEQRTIDIKEAQHGEDQGTAGSTAAAEAEQAKVAQAAEELEKQRQAALERDARQQADEQAREQAAQLAAQQRELAMAEQLKAAQQKAEQLAVQQRAEQLAVQQRAEQLAVQQKAEQQRAEQQRAEQEAAQQGERERASAPASQAPTGGATAGAGGAGGRITVPKNMLGSDLNRRAKELVKGLDLLRGDPPPARMRDERRITVGSTERDLPLRMFALSWGQKIERNGNLNYPRTWAEGVRVDPLVSVALRSDGSVEDVTIIRSSGRADIDEAVRRIVRLNERYSSFPPNIASRYDVIEIRRVWRFGEALKLLEEAR